jgi:transcriptional enhancer factor
MSTKDLSAKVSRHHSSHAGYMRRNNALCQGSSHTSKFDFNLHTGQYPWGTGDPSQKLLSSRSLGGLDTEPYFSLANFGMYVHVDNELVHYYTQLAERARVEDLIVNNVQPWHRQYPELAFHRTGDFKNCQVLVCDSSIQIMTEKQPRNAVLSVQCDVINSYLPLYNDLECRTRFYDAGKLADQFDDEGRITSQTSSRINYDEDINGVQLKFGSNFWVHRMSILTKHLRNARMLEENAARAKIDMDVRRRLQYLTAVQELYGTRRDTNQTECLLTILWRFRQTKSTDEAGQTNWRVARFTSEQACSVKTEKIHLVEEMKPLLDNTVQTTSMYPTLPLDFSHQSFSHHPHQLDLDSFSGSLLEGISDFSNPQSASAPSMTTDFSNHSLPSLSHSQDNGMAHSQEYDPNNINFTGGHINICLEPAIDLAAYEGYASTNPTSMDALQSIAGLEHVHNGAEFDFSGLGVNLTPYAPKPWTCTDIIERLEGLVEQHTELGDHTLEQDIAGHGVLHHGQLDHGLWKLQSPFPEDTGLGADGRSKDDQLPQEQERGLLNFGDRGEKFRLF